MMWPGPNSLIVVYHQSYIQWMHEAMGELLMWPVLLWLIWIWWQRAARKAV